MEHRMEPKQLEQLAAYRERMRRREGGPAEAAPPAAGPSAAPANVQQPPARPTAPPAPAPVPPPAPTPPPHDIDADRLFAERLQREEQEAYDREARERAERRRREEDLGVIPVDENDIDLEAIDVDAPQMPGAFVSGPQGFGRSSTAGSAGPGAPRVPRAGSGAGAFVSPSVDARAVWAREEEAMRAEARQAGGGGGRTPAQAGQAGLTREQLDELMARQMQAEEEGDIDVDNLSSSPPTRPPPARPTSRRPPAYNTGQPDPNFLLRQLLTGRVGADPYDQYDDPFFSGGLGLPRPAGRRLADPTDPFGGPFGAPLAGLPFPLGGRRMPPSGGVTVRIGGPGAGDEAFVVTRDNFGRWRDGLVPLLLGRYGDDLGSSMLGEVPMTYEEMLALADRIGPAVPRGATSEQLASLPTMSYTPPTKPAQSASGPSGASSSSPPPAAAPGPADDPSYTRCAICLEDFAPGAELALMPRCAHRFHNECAREWLRGNATCPICRESIVVGENEVGGEGAGAGAGGQARAGGRDAGGGGAAQAGAGAGGGIFGMLGSFWPSGGGGGPAH